MDQVFEWLGDFDKRPLVSEDKSRANARRSLVAISDIPEGTVIGKEHLTWKRPAYGISPKFLNDILGKKALRDIKEDEIMYWNMLT